MMNVTSGFIASVSTYQTHSTIYLVNLIHHGPALFVVYLNFQTASSLKMIVTLLALLQILVIWEIYISADEYCDSELAPSSFTVGQNVPILGHLNVRSVVSKMDEIKLQLERHRSMILGLSETWLDSSVGDNEVSIDGFGLHRNDRNRNGGGVLVYVPDDLKCFRRYDLECCNVEAVRLQVKVSSETFLLCHVYRPPNVPTSWFDSFENMVECMVRLNAKTVVMGDFNCDMLGNSYHASTLKDMMSTYGFCQSIVDPTRVTQNSESLIDLIFATDVDMFTEFGREELGISDHFLVFGILKQSDSGVSCNEHRVKLVRCLHKCNAGKLIAALRCAPWSGMEHFTDIDHRWIYWKTLFLGIVEAHAPCKRITVRKQSLPWVSSELRKLMMTRNSYMTKAKRTSRSEDWIAYRQLCKEVKYRMRKLKLRYYGLSVNSLLRILGRCGVS